MNRSSGSPSMGTIVYVSFLPPALRRSFSSERNGDGFLAATGTNRNARCSNLRALCRQQLIQKRRYAHRMAAAKKPSPFLSLENDLRKAGGKNETYTIVPMEGDPELRFMRDPGLTAGFWMPTEIKTDLDAALALEALIEAEDYPKFVSWLKAKGNRLNDGALIRFAQHVQEECVPTDPKEPNDSGKSS